jgi:threonine 3-dehydrogenase
MKTILVTGANGEIGHGLIDRYSACEDVQIVALDLHNLDESLKAKCKRTLTGDILDPNLLQSLSAENDFDTIFHLAALLSTKSEREPTLANRVNVDGTLNLLEMAIAQARSQGREVKFIYPSSIATYGLRSLESKIKAGRVKEDDYLTPRTMYGINKLYCERLGNYYSNFYRQLDHDNVTGKLDFRGIRFPGLISAHTVPTGGTSDFAPEMLHAAAQSKHYACFVREDTQIPFMVMPDAIEAMLKLEAAPLSKLTRQVYNIAAFSPTAAEVHTLVKGAFADARITFVPDVKRQGILDSWPSDVDDSDARKDWGWSHQYDLKRAFEEYLAPEVAKRYGG